MNKSKRLVFFGNERLSSGFTPAREDSALQALIANGYDIAAVIAHHGGGTSRSKRELEIESIAKEYEIPVLLPNKPTDIEDELRSFNADAAVLIAYGRIIPERIINLFPRGIINIHPSLLPMYRGPIPIEQAILDGAPKTGVSVMALTKEMDAGPVYVQAEVLLSGDETKFELTRRLFAQGSSLLIQHLPSILDGSLTPSPQDEDLASYCSLLSKETGIMQPEQKSALQLEREVRAYVSFPKSQLMFNGVRLIITKARVAISATDGAFIIPCRDRTYLEIIELIGPSGRLMGGADFLRGYQKK